MIRVFLYTSLSMLAFAGNSLLNRFAVADAGMDPTSFALVRVFAGAAMLVLLVGLRNTGAWHALVPSNAKAAIIGVLGLSTYLAGFSLAYKGLAAGAGALILFGTVQITMFAGAILQGQQIAAARIIGAAIAFLGLITLLWPGVEPVPFAPAAAMMLAGVGWGIYSLAGSSSTDALASTATNFVLAAPLMTMLWWGTGGAALLVPGWQWAALSGAVTSGLGYALWYAVLPKLGAQRAAVAQLTVPLIAATGGAVLLNENVGWRFGLAAALVLGGVAFAILKKPRAKT